MVQVDRKNIRPRSPVVTCWPYRWCDVISLVFSCCSTHSDWVRSYISTHMCVCIYDNICIHILCKWSCSCQQEAIATNSFHEIVHPSVLETSLPNTLDEKWWAYRFKQKTTSIHAKCFKLWLADIKCLRVLAVSRADHGISGSAANWKVAMTWVV